MTNSITVQNNKPNTGLNKNFCSPLNSKNNNVNSCGIIYQPSLTQSNTYQKQLEEEIMIRKQKVLERIQRQKEMEKRLKDFTQHDKVKQIISRNDIKKEIPQSCNASFNGWGNNIEQKKLFLEQKLKEIEHLTLTKPKNIIVPSGINNNIICDNKNTQTKPKVSKKTDKIENNLNSTKEKDKPNNKDKKTKSMKDSISNSSYMINQLKLGSDAKKEKESKLNAEKDKDKKSDKKMSAVKNKQPFQGKKSQPI